MLMFIMMMFIYLLHRYVLQQLDDISRLLKRLQSFDVMQPWMTGTVKTWKKKGWTVRACSYCFNTNGSADSEWILQYLRITPGSVTLPQKVLDPEHVSIGLVQCFWTPPQKHVKDSPRGIIKMITFSTILIQLMLHFHFNFDERDCSSGVSGGVRSIQILSLSKGTNTEV